MIKLISMKCPECGAALQFEENRRTAFCSYCGAKVIVHNENEHIFRSIDEAGIRQAETDRLLMMKELEMEEKKSGLHRTLTLLWIIFTLILIVCALIMISTDKTKDPDGSGYMVLMVGMLVGLWGAIFLFSSNDGKKPIRPGYLKPPAEIINFGKMHYSAVSQTFEVAGFHNINCINLGDLRLGLFRQNGSVQSVTIDGEPLNTGEWYRPDAPVVISYHGYAE